MGFYQPIPAQSARAIFVSQEGDHGALIVTAQGQAQRFTAGITLVRDPNFVGGLRLHVMGWVGPIGEGEQAYAVRATFPGLFYPVIFVNQLRVEVRRVPDEQLADELASAE